MGTVYIVGAGPGDPGLLTLRAVELLDRADALVYDEYIGEAVLERCSPAAERHVVRRGGCRAPGAGGETVALLVELAQRHRRVVRLVGGDPWVFGPAPREALGLAGAGIAFEVVPGVTAGTAAPACAGIPVAARGLSESLGMVRYRPGAASGASGLGSVAAAEALVLFLSPRHLEQAMRELMELGRAEDTPAALIEWGTYACQRTLVGTVGTLAAMAGEAGAGTPSLVVVGEAVRERERLRWFEGRPLFGRRIMITRPRAQAAGFAAMLEELGAEVLQFPTIRITDPADPAPLRAAVQRADRYDWIVFTSVNGVQRFWAELREAGLDTRFLHGVSLCAIGPATAAAIELEGARADLVPDEHVAEAVVEALAAETELRGSQVLLPRASVARDVLPDRLQEQGAQVDDVPAYRTVPDESAAQEARDRLRAGAVDVIAFTASSTVRNFVDLVGTATGGARIASIGPVTSRTAREAGLKVEIEAAQYTVPGLVDAIRRYYSVPSEG